MAVMLKIRRRTVWLVFFEPTPELARHVLLERDAHLRARPVGVVSGVIQNLSQLLDGQAKIL